MTGTCWLHVGDLHVEDADSPSLAAFRRIVDDANRRFARGVDYAILPGDNANDATGAQFALVRDAASRLTLPLHIIPGDHDGAGPDLTTFREILAPSALPRGFDAGDARCLLLDIVSPGQGGPHFAADAATLDWLDAELEAAARTGRATIIHTHAYPADTPGNGDRLAAVIARHAASVVDMGHTHYNELANDGATIYAAVRSTGQIEEGLPGIAIAVIEDGAVSWRFQELGQDLPFVLITAPTDDRLSTRRSRGATGNRLRARAWAASGIASARLLIDGAAGPALACTHRDGPFSVWEASLPAGSGARRFEVEVTDGHGATDRDAVTAGAPGEIAAPADGSDRHRIEPWPEKGIVGGQLGPNRNGRAW